MVPQDNLILTVNQSQGYNPNDCPSKCGKSFERQIKGRDAFLVDTSLFIIM